MTGWQKVMALRSRLTEISCAMTAVPRTRDSRRPKLSGVDAIFDAVTDVLVDVAPVLEGPLQNRFGDAVERSLTDCETATLANRARQPESCDHLLASSGRRSAS